MKEFAFIVFVLLCLCLVYACVPFLGRASYTPLRTPQETAKGNSQALTTPMNFAFYSALPLAFIKVHFPAHCLPSHGSPCLPASLLLSWLCPLPSHLPWFPLSTGAGWWPARKPSLWPARCALRHLILSLSSARPLRYCGDLQTAKEGATLSSSWSQLSTQVHWKWRVSSLLVHILRTRLSCLNIWRGVGDGNSERLMTIKRWPVNKNGDKHPCTKKPETECLQENYAHNHN